MEDRTAPAVLTVTSALDTPTPLAGTLRDAVNQANADSARGQSDTIVFDVARMGTRTINLNQGLLELKAGSGTVTIDGGGQVAVDGKGVTTLFEVDQNARAAFTGLTFQHGSASQQGVPSFGGGLINYGSVQISDCLFTANSAADGGAIENVAGFMTIARSTFSGNQATMTWGGAITNSAILQIGSCTFAGNTAVTAGGAVESNGPLTILTSTFNGNTVTSAYGVGGAIANGRSLLVVNCTIAGNAATGLHGDAGGIYSSAFVMTLQNTIVADNRVSATGTSPDVRGNVGTSVSGDVSHHNLIGDGSGMTGISNGDVNHNLVGTHNSVIRPGLALLASNGGPTQTMALVSGSPAIHTGGQAPPTDQRGQPLDSPPDIGAYQTQPPAAASFTVSAPSTATAGVGFQVTITARDQNGNTVKGYNGPVTVTSSDGQTVFVSPAPVTLRNGTATATLTLNVAHSVTLTASAGTIRGTSGSIAVSPAAAASFSISAPSTATAGSGFSVMITAKDQFGNTVIGYRGPVTLTSSDGQTVFVSPAPVTLRNGTATATLTLNVAHSVTLTASAGSLRGTSTSILVSSAAVASFSVSAPSTATAGTGFQVTITAKDQYGNTVSNYSGPVTLTSSDGQAVQVSPAPVTVSNGTATATVTLNVAHSVTLTASAGTIRGTSGSIAVSPAAVASFSVSAPTGLVWFGFPVTITAQDRYGNVVSNYSGPVTLTSSDGQTVWVTSGTLTLVNGRTTVVVSVGSPSQTRTITLTASAGTIRGTSNPIYIEGEGVGRYPAHLSL
jgi:predicted outer membrane repeat protein